EWHHNFLRNGFPVDSIISHDIDLLDVEAGYYYFIAKLGTSCQSGAFYYQLNDYTPKIVDTNVFITHPSCGLFTGSITGIIVDHGDYSRHTWIDAAGNTYSGSSTGNFAYLGNLPPGRYRLIVTDTIAGCSDTTNWYDLINQAGPSLITGNIQINNSTCGTNNGSITGFTATNVIGVANYTWVDSLNNIVGHNADLVNVTAGKYKLKFKDQGACDTIFTPYYIIPDIGKITIDTSQKIIHPAGCSVNNGSISNIIAVNAITYQWQNLSTSATAGSTIDINNLSAGNYQLSASNSYGCTAVSPVLNIPLSDFTPLSPTSVEIRNANCGENNGSVNILTFNNNIALFTLRWIDSVSNQLIGVNPSISGLGEGTFLLLATDTNGCGKKIYTAHISSLQKPAINYSGMVIINDECSLNNGSITGIAVSGLVGPTSYSWENFYNQQQGNTLNLSDKEAGQYRLTITDGGNCVVQSGWLNINNTDIQLSQPQYDNQTILRNTSATLAIKNFTTGTYSLYSDPFATQLIQENNSGEFVTGNITRDTLFYIKNKSGSCESNPVPVKITVVDKVVVYVPSAFTPNH
ncbi:MAG: hypothetical protein JSU05_13595, partial [Bacteroidetes bacterium]|nr:hypothetical protein [Bacteroidota bacterium]